MEVGQSYLDQLNNNFDLGLKLAQKKIRKLGEKIDSCEQYISYLEKNLDSSNAEVDRLKKECKAIKYELEKCRGHLKIKEETLVIQDNRIIQLEDTIDNLKSRIRELSKSSNKSSEENMAVPDILVNIGTALDRIENYINGDTSFDPRNTLNGIRISITTIRGLSQRHVQDLINMQALLNAANGRITNLMTEVANRGTDYLRRTHLLTLAYNNEVNERRRWWQIAQNVQTNGRRLAIRKQNRINALVGEKAILQLANRRRKDEADLAEFNRAFVFNKYQKWKAKEFNSRQIILNLQNNPPLGNMANLADVHQLIDPQLASLPYYDGQEEPDSYYAKLRTINESARPLAVALFNAAARTNKMIGKMTGRFHPVPAQNPYNGNANIVTEPEFLNWLQGKYREVMVGTNQDAMRALMTEKFSTMDTADTYEKRIKPYAQGLVYGNILPYLYSHMPQYIEMRLRHANPANLGAFFTDLRRIWLESRGRIAEQQPSLNQALPSIQPKDDFRKRLARDLAYNGIAMDDETLEKFIYDELGRRLGSRSAHIRRSPFSESQIRNTNATKKVVKKVVQKAPAKRIVTQQVVRHCSACGKTGHTKVSCPRLKRTKKVNYVYQDEEEDPEDLEDDSEDEEIEEEDDDEDDIEDDIEDETRNCYAVKKKWGEVEYL